MSLLMDAIETAGAGIDLRLDNPEAEIAAMAAWLRAYLEGAGKRRIVIGVSGGVDSAAAAMIAARAVGPENLVLVSLPYGRLKPSRHAPSAESSLGDAARLVERLPGADWRTIDITPAVDAVFETLGLHDTLEGDLTNPVPRLGLGNLKARQRAVHLYAIANLLGDALVLGTENRTENLLGYFTLHGDAASDLEVLSPFLKAQVRQLAAAAGVPSSIIAKAPSADLWPGQTDEGELGFTYDQADRVLAWFFPLGAPPRPREGGAVPGVPETVVRAVLARVDATAWKRAPKPTYERRA